MYCINPENLSATDRLKLNEVTKAISQNKKMIVLTGAGISCNAGIPDFRSENGLYNMVKEKYPNTVVTGKDLFDISLFRSESTIGVFSTFMESLYSHSIDAIPTETHKFIKTLKKKKKLLRCYTQNIDSIERKLQLNTGVVREDIQFKKQWQNLDVVQLHGDLNYLVCSNCNSLFNWNDDYRQVLSDGEFPDCHKCLESYNTKIANGKRSSSLNVGFLRPNIVLYGENHPNCENLSKGLLMDIRLKPDCLIIFGTSLKVHGVRKLVKTLAKEIHGKKKGKVIFVNKTQPSSSQWNDSIDYFIESDCDTFVSFLKSELPDLFLSQIELDTLAEANKKDKLNHKPRAKKTSNNKSMSSLLMTPPTTPTSASRNVEHVEPNSVKSNKAVNELFIDLSNDDDLSSPTFLPVNKVHKSRNLTRKQKNDMKIKLAVLARNFSSSEEIS